ncbi:unnamed protein product [Cuscuta epithymum]|uniref:Uncharacterized protein n=1 Tax=Cuscuta epithymum TaxID=186058 RepID=A0AAV0F4I5_9ASTE|nr:unnamed protein product [Cuscuta epithymum]
MNGIISNDRCWNEEAEGDQDTVIKVLESKLSKSPKALSKSAGRNGCCIFRVHPGLTKVKVQSYQPRIVSIGPYHHGKEHLKMMEEHKGRFLERAVKRTTEKKKGVGLKQYVEAVKDLEAEARACYSEAINLRSDEFVEMLVLDGCFVLEMFRAFSSGEVGLEEDDPFRSMQWIGFGLHHDFLCLENQIPYFVLEKLFELTEIDDETMPNGTSHKSCLSLLALRFFDTSSDEFERKAKGTKDSSLPDGELKGLHLLDLVRKSYFPKDFGEQKKPGSGSKDRKYEDRNLHRISKLRQARIKVKRNKKEERSFLAVGFKRGRIRMPRLALDDAMCAFLLNCVAFEQCHTGSDRLVSSGGALLFKGVLMNT